MDNQQHSEGQSSDAITNDQVSLYAMVAPVLVGISWINIRMWIETGWSTTHPHLWLATWLGFVFALALFTSVWCELLVRMDEEDMMRTNEQQLERYARAQLDIWKYVFSGRRPGAVALYVALAMFCTLNAFAYAATEPMLVTRSLHWVALGLLLVVWTCVLPAVMWFIGHPASTHDGMSRRSS